MQAHGEERKPRGEDWAMQTERKRKEKWRIKKEGEELMLEAHTVEKGLD